MVMLHAYEKHLSGSTKNVKYVASDQVLHCLVKDYSTEFLKKEEEKYHIKTL